MKDTNVVSVTADDVFTTVIIEEKQVMIGTSRLMMMFGAKDLQLKQWTVTDPQGYDTTVAVYNLDTAKKPDPEPVRDQLHAILRRDHQSVSGGKIAEISWRRRRLIFICWLSQLPAG